MPKLLPLEGHKWKPRSGLQVREKWGLFFFSPVFMT